jgi:hypothetical protein
MAYFREKRRLHQLILVLIEWPLHGFWGGIEKTLYYKDGTEKGKRVTMADGSTMNWRKVSSSADKSPEVDIDIERSNDHGELVTQKIHFMKR